jgi:predicted permease
MLDWKREVEERLAGLRIEPAREAVVVEELAQHLEDRYQELRSGGADDRGAYEAALSELRDEDLLSAGLRFVDRTPKREPFVEGVTGTGNLPSDFVRDLRYAVRAMRKTPGFSFFAILTLALGIGANATVFTIINTLLLHPLPAQDPSQLVALYGTESRNSKQSGSLLDISYLNLKDYAARNSVFSSTAGYTQPMVMTLSESSGPKRVFGDLVMKGYFETLGIRPARGRFFLPEENDTPGSAAVAVLSYNAWNGQFGSAPDIIGRTLRINDVMFTVIGVAPKGFIGISNIFGPDVWFPASMAGQVFSASTRDGLTNRARTLFHGVARLKAGGTRAQAEANLRTIAAALQTEYPDANEGRTVVVRPITDELFGRTGGENPLIFGSLVLLVIVGLVLIIACSNVANLLLARAAARKQEIAVRLAIGASRQRLVRQLLTESVLLGLLGGVAGLAIGYEGCQFLWSFRPPEVAQNLIDPKLDANVFLFALLVSLATGFVFGVVPALRASKADVVEALKEETRTAGRGRRSVTFGNAILVGQVALSLVSLITAALFLRSIERAYQIDPGFQTNHLAIFMMNPEQAGYDQAHTKEFYREIRERVSTLPGVAAASWTSNMPFWNGASQGVSIEGQEQRKKSEAITTVVNTVDPNHFAVMQIPLLRGREFTEGDREDTLPVAIINEAMAQRYWPRGDAIGRGFHFSGDKTVRQIIGIAKTTNYSTLGEAPQPCIYLPLRQKFSEGITLYVRSKSDPIGILMPVQREIRNIDPKIAVSDIRTGAKIIDQVLFTARLGVGLLGVFGLLALVLASVGLYGIMAYSVNRREREIGLRMALGAEQSNVLRLILRQGMAVVGIGIAVGLAASFVMDRALTRMLYGISSADPLSLVGASVVLIAIALLACYLPARSASRVDPMMALREG